MKLDIKTFFTVANEAKQTLLSVCVKRIYKNYAQSNGTSKICLRSIENKPTNSHAKRIPSPALPEWLM